MIAESISFQSTTAAGEQLFILGQDDLRVKSGRGRTVVIGKEKVTLCASVIMFTTPQGVNQYKVEWYALEKEENIKPKGSRNPVTGGDSSFSLQYEFNGLARQGVMAGTQYERYFAFQDEPSYEKDYSTGWKILAGIAAAVLVGVAIGALALIAGPVAAAIIGISAAQLAVGTGIITAGIGIIATLGTYNNDKRNGTTSSIGDYVGNAYTADATVGGAPYPNSSIAKIQPYSEDYVDGSIVEFTGQDPGNNSELSKYVVAYLVVYKIVG